jgi:galactitol PTS system EIIA component
MSFAPETRLAGTIMAEIIISDKLIKLSMQASTKEDAIRTLSDPLYELDYVREGYYEHVIGREKDFPTGLPAVIPVAVCHTEAEYVKQSALAVGTLVHPIAFQEMGTPERTVQAEIIFLLALNDPKQQVPWLKKMASLFKDRKTLETIRHASDPLELARSLKTLFQVT